MWASSSKAQSGDKPSLGDADVTHLPSARYSEGETGLLFEKHSPNELIRLHRSGEWDRTALLPEKEVNSLKALAGNRELEFAHSKSRKHFSLSVTSCWKAICHRIYDEYRPSTCLSTSSFPFPLPIPDCYTHRPLSSLSLSLTHTHLRGKKRETGSVWVITGAIQSLVGNWGKLSTLKPHEPLRMIHSPEDLNVSFLKLPKLAKN